MSDLQLLNVEDSLTHLSRIETESGVAPHPRKFEAKRIELARAALGTMARLGFADTSIRQIATDTEYSHGVIHYYFKDKVDLITCCVQDYKRICATRYDGLIENSQTEEEFLTGFGDIAFASLTREAPLHRLWYDLRVQSMFNTAYRENIVEIDRTLERMTWRIYSTFCAFSGVIPRQSSARIYGLFDGLFQTALLYFITAQTESGVDLKGEMMSLLLDLRSIDEAKMP